MSENDSENKNSSSSPLWNEGLGPLDVNCLLREAIDIIDRNFNVDKGIYSGFTALDAITQGLHAGELTVVGSRPSIGKTTFVLNIVESVLQNSEKNVVVYSPEIPAPELLFKILSSMGRIDQMKLRDGRLEDDDWPKLTSAVNMLKDRKLSIDDDYSISLEKIRSRTHRLVQERGELGLIVVDNLQMIQVDGNKLGCRSNENAEILCGLKALAREFKCPIVVTSHLNRNLENRQQKRPRCSDLADSGSIEQMADVILFIYRDELYQPRTKHKGVAEIIIGKHRFGHLGTVRLDFVGKYSRFENREPEWIYS